MKCGRHLCAWQCQWAAACVVLHHLGGIEAFAPAFLLYRFLLYLALLHLCARQCHWAAACAAFPDVVRGNRGLCAFNAASIYAHGNAIGLPPALCIPWLSPAPVGFSSCTMCIVFWCFHFRHLLRPRLHRHGISAPLLSCAAPSLADSGLGMGVHFDGEPGFIVLAFY